jgi:hypothetical protein
MSTRSPYPDVEVPEISLPRFVLDRSGQRGAVVPLMGPADRGTMVSLMGPADPGHGHAADAPRPVMRRRRPQDGRLAWPGTRAWPPRLGTDHGTG